MVGTLDQWQQKLEQHFAKLAAARRSAGLPVFALEHGLCPDEFREVSSMLRERLGAGLRLGQHWLLWVVYAAEQGYDYDGHEYWHSFEARTPHWRECGDRRWIREWFHKFHTAYAGVKPTGPWAEWFSIIAWPITHAVLPKDLQQQLAKALYDLRHRLVEFVLRRPAEVGRLVVASSYDESARFRIFLQQEELAGRIVLALLDGPASDGPGAIHGPTLRRIVADLETTRNAREWLRDARRAVAVVRFNGAAPATIARRVGGPALRWSADDAGSRPANIQPLLTLRRTGSDAWTVVLELPSLASLQPDLRAFLKGTRCTVAGAVGGWLPAGWLLYGMQRRVVASWPDHAKPVLAFERPNAALEHLLQSECRITPGPIWVCRVGSDGTAREVTSRLVRPGQDYVLLHYGKLDGSPLLRPCAISCEGIHAAALSVPTTLTLGNINAIEQLGLSVACIVRVWPAGLPARSWDGEGHTEWVSGETPCFGIVHDHPVDAFALRLDGDREEVDIEAGAAGQPLFVRLPPLQPGPHTLLVTAKYRGSFKPLSGQHPAEGLVRLLVRPPEPWVPGQIGHSGLLVTVKPHEPTLDAFWTGEARVSVLGPDGRQVACLVSLLGAAGEVLLNERIAIFTLPVTEEAWSRQFAQFAARERDPWFYLTASSGRLVVDGDELGKFKLPLHRDVTPVRWICVRGQRATALRLADDTGRDDPLAVHFFDFRCPTIAEAQDTRRCIAGFEPPRGGLYLATREDHRQGVVVSLPRVDGGLRGLVLDPNPDSLPSRREEVPNLLEAIEVWSDARLAGPLAAARRDRVLKTLRDQLFSILCGERWANAELRFFAAPGSTVTLASLLRSVGGPPGFAEVIRRNLAGILDAGPVDRVRHFLAIAERYRVCSEAAICESALRLAGQPHRIRVWAGADLEQRLRALLDFTILLRGARLLTVVGAGEDSSVWGPLSRGWET